MEPVMTDLDNLDRELLTETERDELQDAELDTVTGGFVEALWVPPGGFC
jgi:hypothetical protein